MLLLRYRDINSESDIPILGDYVSVVKAATVLGVHWETAFNINGIGLLMVDFVFNKDYVVLQADTLRY
jgi:ABC-type dipeptide/oligopeptide/nickel transport system permease component